MKAKKLSTKDKIVLKAVELFNERGTQNITTNHIAKEAGISAGNLYYHFRNKEEIVRAVYEKMSAEFDIVWGSRVEGNELFNVTEKITESLRLFYKYKFFMTEIVSLIKNDIELKRRYIEAKNKRKRELAELFLEFKRGGYLKQDITEQEIDSLIEVLWFTGDFWIMKNEFKESPNSEATNEEIESYLKATYIICRSFFKEEVLKEFKFEKILKEIK